MLPTLTVFIVTDLIITGNERPHQILSSVNISCSSDLAVQTIRWLNNSDNGQEIFYNSGQQQLLLPIEKVTISLANTTYTCEVQVMLETRIHVIRETITFTVDGMLEDTEHKHFMYHTKFTRSIIYKHTSL